MIFDFDINDEFSIKIIKNIYNKSNCTDIINKTTTVIKCQDFLYDKYKECCNNYIKQYINNTTSIGKCYNNSNLIYEYECDYIKHYELFILIMVFFILMCVCVCGLAIKYRKEENEEKKRLISHS
jgi:hypothetical protein